MAAYPSGSHSFLQADSTRAFLSIDRLARTGGGVTVVTVKVASLEVTCCSPNEPFALAMLTISPAATSASVTVYVPVQVVLAPGASEVVAQVMPVTLSSVIAMAVIGSVVPVLAFPTVYV
ncbi:hypothetical protein GA0070215_101443 [Micromonospora marina]|uniref:Uncharacterized protein n=1 Tax=Micromonospora marina TaxID=307120 RepID=A0A1C4UF61_9ACTN|nr:hypothetical protein GA0070215_101443 [Micromonospora marina]